MKLDNVVNAALALVIGVILAGTVLIPTTQNSLPDVTYTISNGEGNYDHVQNFNGVVYNFDCGQAFELEGMSEQVASIVCSPYTTWFVTPDGRLFGCGSGGSGQQGSGDTVNVRTFTQRATDVASVACSNNTTWYVTTDGRLFGTGINTNGQQGSGDTTNVTTFTQRATDVASVACSNNTTWYVTTDGRLFGCGNIFYALVDTFTQYTATTSDIMDYIPEGVDVPIIVTSDFCVYGDVSAERVFTNIELTVLSTDHYTTEVLTNDNISKLSFDPSTYPGLIAYDDDGTSTTYNTSIIRFIIMPTDDGELAYRALSDGLRVLSTDDVSASSRSGSDFVAWDNGAGRVNDYPGTAAFGYASESEYYDTITSMTVSFGQMSASVTGAFVPEGFQFTVAYKDISTENAAIWYMFQLIPMVCIIGLAIVGIRYYLNGRE